MGIQQTKTPNTIFPDVPRETPMIGKDGKATEPWLKYFDQLTVLLQQYFRNEGFAMPKLSATNIGNIGNTNASVGNIIYDSTNNLFKGILLVTPGTPLTPPVTVTKTFTLTLT